MTIRFAAAWTGKTSAMAPSLCRGASLAASNDNQPPRRTRHAPLQAAPVAPEPVVDQEVSLAKALMHFARYGLSAASRARSEAQVAHAAGDRQARALWLDICRHLDRRMAASVARDLVLD